MVLLGMVWLPNLILSNLFCSIIYVIRKWIKIKNVRLLWVGHSTFSVNLLKSLSLDDKYDEKNECKI